MGRGDKHFNLHAAKLVPEQEGRECAPCDHLDHPILSYDTANYTKRSCSKRVNHLRVYLRAAKLRVRPLSLPCRLFFPLLLACTGRVVARALPG
jgi:hypothetical protein